MMGFHTRIMACLIFLVNMLGGSWQLALHLQFARSSWLTTVGDGSRLYTSGRPGYGLPRDLIDIVAVFCCGTWRSVDHVSYLNRGPLVVQQQCQGFGDARTSHEVGVVRGAAKHRAYGLDLLSLLDLLRLDGYVSSVEVMRCEGHAWLILIATL